MSLLSILSPQVWISGKVLSIVRKFSVSGDNIRVQGLGLWGLRESCKSTTESADPNEKRANYTVVLKFTARSYRMTP